MTSRTLRDVTPSSPDVRRLEAAATVRALLHDLRQPLAAISLLADGEPSGQRLAGIREQARWMSELVEEVLSGPLKPGPCDVATLVADVVSRTRPTSACGLTLVLDDDAVACIGAVALTRAVACVLDNAVRAAGALGQVHVSVSLDGSDVHVVVEDDGPGLGHVPSRTSMGLTITRALVASCGGSFSLRPAATAGAIARITLPAATAEAVAS